MLLVVNMPIRESATELNVAWKLLAMSGVIVAGYGLLFNEYVVGFFDPEPPLLERTADRVRKSQLFLILAGVLLIAFSMYVRRKPIFNSVLNRPRTVGLLFLCLVLFISLSIGEATLRPFAGWPQGLTTIFEKDAELGWKLRPNAEDVWCGKKVKINAKGLRGPDIPYQKAENVFRILFLGDSVTFGCLLSSHEQTFPYIVQRILPTQLGREVETFNAGVGGYSPWQEYIYLSREGIRYQPDLVVVSFVLNDIVEKFGLVMFGGWGEGFQLHKTAHSLLDRIYDMDSGIMYFARNLGAQLRFGTEIQKGAIKEEHLRVTTLVEFPEQPSVKKAWDVTLANLHKIFKFCKDRDIPAILVGFPYAFQLEDPEKKAAPQLMLSRFSEQHGIAFIDLLPILAGQMRENGTKPEVYFADANHPSPYGSEQAARIISNYIVSRMTNLVGSAKAS